MPKLLFVFLDGVGLGSGESEINPFVVAKTPFLEGLLGAKLTASVAEISRGDVSFRAIDACLGYEGLPQSATGQTALLTGQNGASFMKGHYGPWPGPSLKKELDKGSLFTEVLASGQQAQLANVYPPGFFRALELRKQKMNVPVYAAQAAGLELRGLERYARGEAISLDLTGEFLGRYGEYAQLTPFEMGQRLADVSQEAAFSFFDYWPSDSVGHRGSFSEAVSLIEKLDFFLKGVAENLKDVTLLVSSDHGNLEDKTLKTHTRALVPLLVVGEGARFFTKAQSIMDVAPSVRRFLKL